MNELNKHWQNIRKERNQLEKKKNKKYNTIDKV